MPLEVAVHRWAGLTGTKYHDLVLEDHIRAHPEPQKQSRDCDKTFLPKVQSRGCNQLFGGLAAALYMAGWAAVLWIAVSLVAFFIHGHWHLPLTADLGY